MKRYKFYADPGHGWLKVSKLELAILGIADQISEYSYMRATYAYLEEDCDAPLFINVLGVKDFDSRVIYCRSNRDSKIRSYQSYVPLATSGNPFSGKI